MTLREEIIELIYNAAAGRDIFDRWDAENLADLILALIESKRKPNPFYKVFNASARDECHKCGRPRGVCSC